MLRVRLEVNPQPVQPLSDQSISKRQQLFFSQVYLLKCSGLPGIFISQATSLPVPVSVMNAVFLSDRRSRC